MKCDEIRELLSLYLDNMLDENQVQEVEQHLSSCDACRKEYNELKDMLELLGQAEMFPVPDEFSFRLKKALKEEKQKMIDDGLIAKLPKKKSQWRIITSVAAIFALCVISYSLYDHELGNVPFFNNGEDQAGPSAKTEETYKLKTADAADNTGVAGGSAQDSASSSDGTVVMKNQANDLQPMTENLEIQSELADSDSTQTYGAVAPPEPNAGDQSAEIAAAQQDSASEAGDNGGEFTFKSSMILAQDECSRSLTGSGLERNSAAVQYYNKLIEEKLSGFDYQVLESTYTQTGEWQYRIFIFRGKDGNTYNEEIRVIGKDGEIETICSNDFMGL